MLEHAGSIARASLVCMSMQYAQPLSCDARILTSSRRAGSNPDSFTTACKPNILGKTFDYVRIPGLRPNWMPAVKSVSVS
jgi:hypothetical protein